MKQDNFKILSKEVVYQGYFRMAKYCIKHKLYAGGWSDDITREVFERGDSAAVLLHDPKRQKVILVEQFRAGCLTNQPNPWVIELVAGRIEEDESANEVAIREAKEEANCEISNLIKIGQFVLSAGACDEKITLFAAEIDSHNKSGIFGLPEENEDIKLITMSYSEAWQALTNGKIVTAPTVIALQWLKINQSY